MNDYIKKMRIKLNIKRKKRDGRDYHLVIILSDLSNFLNIVNIILNLIKLEE